MSVSVADALEISGVRSTRAAFDPAIDEYADIRFSINEPASVDLDIYDGRDLLVRRVTSADILDVGEHTLRWDGKDELRKIVPPEAYHYVLRSITKAGARQTFDLTDITGGEAVAAEDLTWDPLAKRIRYRIAKAARVNVRVVLQDNGPLLRTIVDLVPRKGGENEVAWDGWDASRALDLSEHPKLSIFIDAYSLSDNSLLVGPPAERIAFVDLPQEARQIREKQIISKKLVHYHHQQPLAERGDVAITVSLPDGLPEDAEGLPILTGLIPVKLEVEPQDRQRVIDRRFEPVFFIDGTFVFENEVGYLPFTWIWNTATANEGIHYITVNLRGYEGNFGMATQKVRVEHASSRRGE